VPLSEVDTETGMVTRSCPREKKIAREDKQEESKARDTAEREQGTPSNCTIKKKRRGTLLKRSTLLKKKRKGKSSSDLKTFISSTEQRGP